MQSIQSSTRAWACLGEPVRRAAVPAAARPPGTGPPLRHQLDLLRNLNPGQHRRVARAFFRPAWLSNPSRRCGALCPVQASAAAEVQTGGVLPTDLSHQKECGIIIKFELPHETCFGQSHRIVGNFIELGGWEVDNSLCLEWTEGHVWKACVVLAPGCGPCMFKCVKVNSDGSVEWQSGDNRFFEVPGDDCGSLRVRCRWDSEDLQISTEPRQHHQAATDSSASLGSSVDKSLELTEILESFCEGSEVSQPEASSEAGPPSQAMKTGKLSAVAKALMQKKEKEMKEYRRKSQISASKIEDLQNVLNGVRDSQKKLQNSLESGDGKLNSALFQHLSDTGTGGETAGDADVLARAEKWRKSKQSLSTAIQKAATENRALFEQLRLSQRALEYERAMHQQHQRDWEEQRAGYTGTSAALQEDHLHAMEEELKAAKDEAIELGEKLAVALQTLDNERSEHREWAVKWEEERSSLREAIREGDQSAIEVDSAHAKVKELEDQIAVAEAKYQEEHELCQQLQGREADWEGLRTQLEGKVASLHQTIEDSHAAQFDGNGLQEEIERLERRLHKEQKAQMTLRKMSDAFQIAKNALEADLDNTQTLVVSLQETLQLRTGETEEIKQQLIHIQQTLHKERASAKASRDEQDHYAAQQQDLEEQLKAFQQQLSAKSSEATDLAGQVSQVTTLLKRETQASQRLRQSLEDLAGTEKALEQPRADEEGIVLAIGARLSGMQVALDDETEKVQRLTDELKIHGQREQDLLHQISHSEECVQTHAARVAELESCVEDLTSRLQEEQLRNEQLVAENGTAQQTIQGLQDEAVVAARALASSEARAKDLQHRLRATEKDLLKQKGKSNALENGAAHWRQAERQLQQEYKKLKQDLTLQLEEAEELLDSESEVTSELRDKVKDLDLALALETKKSQRLQVSAAQWAEAERSRQKQLATIQMSMLKNSRELEETLANSENMMQEEKARREQLEVHNAALAESELQLQSSLAEHQESIKDLEEKLGARSGEVKGLMMELVAAMSELSKHQIKLIPPSNPVTRKQLERLSRTDLQVAAKRAGIRGNSTSAAIIQQLLDAQSHAF